MASIKDYIRMRMIPKLSDYVRKEWDFKRQAWRYFDVRRNIEILRPTYSRIRGMVRHWQKVIQLGIIHNTTDIKWIRGVLSEVKDMYSEISNIRETAKREMRMLTPEEEDRMAELEERIRETFSP